MTAPVLSRFLSQAFVACLAKSSQADLTVIHDLMTGGKVTPVIDKRYSLSEDPAAIRYLEQGHARGKVVVTMSNL
jgi:NADPH:quinone reductase-like Zn-dependent oxidoreductase